MTEEAKWINEWGLERADGKMEKLIADKNLPYVPANPTADDLFVAQRELAYRLKPSASRSITRGFIEEVKRAGTLPTVFLGWMALVSSEWYMFDVDMGYTIIFLGGWVVYRAAFSKYLSDALKKSHTDMFDKYLNGMKADREYSLAQIRSADAVRAMPEVEKEFFAAFNEANAALVKAREMTAKKARTDALLAQLKAMKGAEVEAQAKKQLEAQAASADELTVALSSTKLKAAIMDEAINAIGTQFKGNFKALDDLMAEIKKKNTSA